MVSLFKQKSGSSVLMLALLSLFVHIAFLIEPPAVFFKSDSGLSGYLFSHLPKMPDVFLSFIYHVVILIQAIRLNYILQNHRMVTISFLPAMTYILFTGLYPYWNNISPALISNFFIIWLFALALKLPNVENKTAQCFTIGFVTGFTLLFYPPLMFLTVVMLISILSLTTFQIRNILLYLLGLVLPFYFGFAYFYLTDNLQEILKFVPHFGWEIPSFEKGNHLIVVYSLMLLLIIAGSIMLRFNNMLISARKGWSMLYTILLVAPLGIFILKNYSFETLLVVIAPAAAIASNFFINNRSKIVSALVFWILFLACFYPLIEKYILS